MSSSHVVFGIPLSDVISLFRCYEVMRDFLHEILMHNMRKAHKMYLLCISKFRNMTTLEIIRKIQFRQGSFVVTIPKKMATILGINPNQYALIRAENSRIIISPLSANKMQDDHTLEYEPSDDAQYTDELTSTHTKDLHDSDKSSDEGTSQLDGLKM